MTEKDEEKIENEDSETIEDDYKDAKNLKKALAKEREKAARYKTNWQKAEADLSNYKKRTEQEKNELTKFANSALILNLLPILDDLERAFASITPKLEKLDWVEGVRMIQRKLQSILENQGLSQIECIGKCFDPCFHEAVAHLEGEEGMVIDEVQKGYELKDKVLRPSMVVVGKGKEEKPEDRPGETN